MSGEGGEVEVLLRPLLVGEAPSRGGDRYHSFPLSGPPARVLCQLAGVPPDPDGSTYGRWTWALYDRFECVNLIERYAQAEPWSVVRARQHAVALRGRLEGRVVVCLGRRVHQAVMDSFYLGEEPFHQWVTFAPYTTRLVGVPHPSGLNRALNDPAERERCGDTLRAALSLSLLPG